LTLAVVAEKRARDLSLPVIFGVEEEIQHVVRVANESNVQVLHSQTGATTVADTARIMQAANVVHLACHGVQDTLQSTNSGFCLGDGRLTISKLKELKPNNAFMAFLSSCETAKGDDRHPDQAMHLAAAMLFAGFNNIIATKW
jgi:CHAT domain-containing protein